MPYSTVTRSPLAVLDPGYFSGEPEPKPYGEGERAFMNRCQHQHGPIAAVFAMTVVVALAFGLAVTVGAGSHFNPDESRWISRAHYLAALTDPLGPTWADQYMTRGQPPLGSYAMGIGLLLQGRDLNTNPPWDFSRPWEENIALGHKPIADDLAAGRRTSAALIAITAFVLIPVARTFVSLPWAILAGALFAIHPFSAYIGSIAVADALFGFLIALTAWAAAGFARQPNVARAIGLGVALGLGAATKLSPLAVAAGLTIGLAATSTILSFRAQRDRRPRRLTLAPSLLISVAAFVTFVAVYPYLWPDPVARTRHLFAFRVEEMAAQSADWPVMAVPTRAEALRRVHINFSERYNLAAATADRLDAPGTPLLLRNVEVLVAVAGIAIMASQAARDGPLSPRTLVLAVLGGQVLVTILGMRSEFDRYHVPMALLGAVAAAVALGQLAGVAHWWRLASRLSPGGSAIPSESRG